MSEEKTKLAVHMVFVERGGGMKLTRSHVAGYMLRTSKGSLTNGTLVVASHGEERDERKRMTVN